MEWVCWGVVILGICGVAAWVNRGRMGFGEVFGVGGCFIGCGMGLYGAGNALFFRLFESRRGLWNAPYASLALGLDSLSAVFLVCVFAVGLGVALAATRKRAGDFSANRPHEHWLYLDLLVAAAGLTVISRNAVVFLFAWQAATTAAFLLIEGERRGETATDGGWLFLLYGQGGWVCLIVAFLLMLNGPNLDFASLGASEATANAVFLLAFVCFAAKAGVVPVHGWLPATAARASAQSGALASVLGGCLGMYGMFRFLLLLGGSFAPPWWWAALCLGVGLASAAVGLARMFPEKDVYKAIGWSTVVASGLAFACVGLGLAGMTFGMATAPALAFAAALFLVLGHAVAKTLLFLTAGAIQARTGTRMLGGMGGLWRRMPSTAVLFLIGAVGACGLPPLNCFPGIFLGLKAAVAGIRADASGPFVAMTIAFLVLLLAAAVGGGLCFGRIFASLFLGQPRGPGAASEAGDNRWHLLPHIVLAVASVYFVVVAPRLADLIGPTAEVVVKLWARGAAAADMAPIDPDAIAFGRLYLWICVIGGALLLLYRVAAPARFGTPVAAAPAAPAAKTKGKKKRRNRR